MTAALAAAMVLVASTLAVTSSLSAADAKPRPKKARPNLGVSSVLAVPPEVLAGSSVAVKVLLGNDGRAAAPRSLVSVHLSRDTKRSAGDPRVGSARVPKLGPWKTHVAPAQLKVPGSAKGVYHVIACADARHQVRERNEKNNCRASLSTVDVIRPVNGTLRGTIDLFDVGSNTSGSETWSRSAQLKVALQLNGRGREIRSTDIGSSYVWLGESTTSVVVPECPTTKSETEDGDGPFASSDGRRSSLTGSAVNTQLSKLELTSQMAYDVTGKITSPCSPTLPYIEERELVTLIDLEQVSSTASTITYKVGDTWEQDVLPSGWEEAQGRLTLTLR